MQIMPNITSSIEQWRPVPGYEGLYEVSDYGRVRRSARGQHTQIGRIIKPFPQRGYWRIQLNKNGKKHKHSVHTLVLKAFVGDPSPGQECRHKDNDPGNNHVSNLIWGTKLENETDKVESGRTTRGIKQWNSALTETDVHEIRLLLAKGIPQRIIAEQFNVGRSAIALIHIGKTWAWLKSDALPSIARETTLQAQKNDFDAVQVKTDVNAQIDANISGWE